MTYTQAEVTSLDGPVEWAENGHVWEASYNGGALVAATCRNCGLTPEEAFARTPLGGPLAACEGAGGADD